MESSLYKTRQLKKDECERLKELRLKSLLDDPDSYWDSFEDTRG